MATKKGYNTCELCVPSYEGITNGGSEFFTQLEIPMRKVVGDALEEWRGAA